MAVMSGTGLAARRGPTDLRGSLDARPKLQGEDGS